MSESPTVATAIIKQLEQYGIKRFYALIGDSLNPFGVAVSESSIEWISVRHEENAAFAAAGETFISGKLCVCAGTCGPGSAHLINGLYEANANKVPVLAIVTHIPSSQIGFDYFQTTHPERVFPDCSVYCETLSNPMQMPRILRTAAQTAIAKRGVAVIIISGDIATLPTDLPALPEELIYPQTLCLPESEKIKELADFLNSQDKTVLYCGIGCKNAMLEIRKLCSKIKSPMLHTVRAKDFAAYDNPYDIGMHGFLGWHSELFALQNCDSLLLLGIDYPFSQLLPEQAKIAQVDICASHLGRRSNRLDVGVTGDVKTVLGEVMPFITDKKDSSFLKQSITHAQTITNNMRKSLNSMAASDTLRPEYLTYRISEIADDDAIFLIDVGLNDIWAARYITGKKNRVIAGSFRHGTMGAAIGEAIGTYFANPAKQIIVLVGDGGLTMFLGELLTVKYYNIPLKMIIYNNCELGFINLESAIEGYKPFATELDNPDFANVASAMNLKSFSVAKPDNLDNILNEAFSSSAPVLINAWTDRNAIGLLDEVKNV